MSSTSETGHAKNLSNLESLITFCGNFGTDYDPANPAFGLNNLTALHTAGKAALQTLFEAKNNYDTVVNQRKEVFAQLRPLATKALNALTISGVSDDTIDDARGYYNKIIGRRSAASAKAKAKAAKAAGAATTPSEELPRTISVSQQSYDKQVEHYAQLVAMLTAETRYKPNEKALQVTSLSALLSDMRAKNSAVIVAFAALSNARMKRDQIFDAPKVGLVDVCLDAKTYVKSVFGVSSAQYKQVSSLRFVRYN